MKYVYAPNIGGKFNPDGSVRYFPGNTVISMIDHGAPIYREFCALRERLKARAFSRSMTLLPDDSLHMTVFEGVCSQWRARERWTSLLPTDCRLSEVDDLFERRFPTAAPLGPVEMRAVGVGGKGGLSMRLAPATEADERELRRYRDDLSRALGLRAKDHDSYGFHISIGYFTHPLTGEDEAEIDAFCEEARADYAARDVRFTPQPPILTYFNDMFFFHPRRIEREDLQLSGEQAR